MRVTAALALGLLSLALHPAKNAALLRVGNRAGRGHATAKSKLRLLPDPSLVVDQLHSLQHVVTAAAASVSGGGSSHWAEYAAQGLADAASADAAPAVCPGWGEPGWAPFCFLNGNPVFKAFDAYQAFIQNSVVTLRNFYHDKVGLEESYGPSIISFTVLIRLIILPLTFRQLKSSSQTMLLTPKINEIKERFPDNKETQNQLIALLYQETNTNPLAGCLPALVQIPVFLALYRSFLNLASTNQMAESFLWLPNLEGPVFGSRSTDWLFKGWENNVPALGWHDTVAYLSIPVLLYAAQAISLNLISPPSDDPTIAKTQRILKYLPLVLAYFSLSVPAGLGLYWITNNALSTISTVSIKEYFKRNSKAVDFDIDSMITSPYYLPVWGYTTQEDMLQEAKENNKKVLASKIPADWSPSS